MRKRTRGAVLPVFLLAAAVLFAPVASAASGDEGPLAPGVFGFTLEPVSPLTQSWPTINFLGPYYYFLLTNTAAEPDSFRLRIENLTQPSWFPQVCLRSICFPDSTTLRFEPGAADTVGVNLVPVAGGVGEADFVVTSVGNPLLSRTFHVTLYAGSAAVSVETGATPTGLQLSPAWPNPARGSARIAFVLPRSDRVALRVFDVSGRLVATLVDGVLPEGSHSVQWDGEIAGAKRAPAGAYFYRLETPLGSRARSLVLLR